MNDEQICDFYLRAKEANLTFEKINETLKQFASNFIYYNVVRDREVNVVESVLDVDDKLEGISNELSSIRHALNRIADSLENHGTLTLELKSDPSDGPFCSQKPEEPEGFADMA